MNKKEIILFSMQSINNDLKQITKQKFFRAVVNLRHEKLTQNIPLVFILA